MRKSIMYVVGIWVFTFVHAGAFCILSNSIIRNEIGDIKSIWYHQMNQINISECFEWHFVNRSVPIGSEIFRRPKIFFQKFSTRPTRWTLHGIFSSPFRTFHWKSVQNRRNVDVQHVQHLRLIGKSSKKWKFALFVKEKGRNGCTNTRQSRSKFKNVVLMKTALQASGCQKWRKTWKFSACSICGLASTGIVGFLTHRISA